MSTNGCRVGNIVGERDTNVVCARGFHMENVSQIQGLSEQEFDALLDNIDPRAPSAAADAGQGSGGDERELAAAKLRHHGTPSPTRNRPSVQPFNPSAGDGPPGVRVQPEARRDLLALTNLPATPDRVGGHGAGRRINRVPGAADITLAKLWEQYLTDGGGVNLPASAVLHDPTLRWVTAVASLDATGQQRHTE